MGDIIETVTWPRHRLIFYSATSSAIAVDIKGRGQASIGLSSHSHAVSAHELPQDAMTDIQIEIADVADNDGNRFSLIEMKQGDRILERLATRQILDDDDYGSFWLSWYGEKLRLERKGETTPLFDSNLSLQKLYKLKYITFSTKSEQNEVRWRFQQPPVIERPRKFVTVSGGKPRWKRGVDHQPNYKDNLPNEAIIGGFENEPLYIIRAFAPDNGQLVPGKFVRSEGLAYIGWGGQSYAKEEFDVLCGFDYLWVPASYDRIPANAVKGGYDKNTHEVLYVGRAYHDGHLIPGKVCYSHQSIYIPYKNREISLRIYEVLTEPKEEKHIFH